MHAHASLALHTCMHIFPLCSALAHADVHVSQIARAHERIQMLYKLNIEVQLMACEPLAVSAQNDNTKPADETVSRSHEWYRSASEKSVIAIAVWASALYLISASGCMALEFKGLDEGVKNAAHIASLVDGSHLKAAPHGACGGVQPGAAVVLKHSPWLQIWLEAHHTCTQPGHLS